MRHTADWKSKPLSEETLSELVEVLSREPKLQVRRALLVLSGAIEKVVDNEADGQETLRRYRERKLKGDL